MNKYLAQAILCIALILFSATNLSGQVTIGSKQPPLAGALLDLKEDGTTTKGLGLPRVSLKDPYSLDDVGGGSSAADKEAHTGLLIYNPDANNELCPGLYVWDSERWQMVPGDGRALKVNTSIQANSFIIPLGHHVEVPITKAINMWATHTSLSSVATLNTADLLNDAEAELLWQDNPNLFRKIALTKKADGTIVMRLTLDCQGALHEAGNALVAIRIPGTDGLDAQGKTPIRWSWHLWVTDYDPDTKKNGTTYAHNNGTPGGDYEFMDRRLGALSGAEDDPKTIGMAYQWGRKDPFPPQSDFIGTPTTLYDIDGTVIPSTSETIDGILVKSTPATSGTSNNLANSIKEPQYFYNGNGWYASHRSQPSLDDGLWKLYTNQGGKTEFDPCPEGWRVPIDKNNQNPHTNLSNVLPDTYGALHPDYGYIPYTGSRSQGGGLMYPIASSTNQTYEWGGAEQWGTAYYQSAEIMGGSIYSVAMQEGWGIPVRCMKE